MVYSLIALFHCILFPLLNSFTVLFLSSHFEWVKKVGVFFLAHLKPCQHKISADAFLVLLNTLLLFLMSSLVMRRLSEPYIAAFLAFPTSHLRARLVFFPHLSHFISSMSPPRETLTPPEDREREVTGAGLSYDCKEIFRTHFCHPPPFCFTYNVPYLHMAFI